MKTKSTHVILILIRGVDKGGPGGSEPPRNLANQLTLLIQTRGAVYAPRTKVGD